MPQAFSLNVNACHVSGCQWLSWTLRRRTTIISLDKRGNWLLGCGRPLLPSIAITRSAMAHNVPELLIRLRNSLSWLAFWSIEIQRYLHAIASKAACILPGNKQWVSFQHIKMQLVLTIVQDAQIIVPIVFAVLSTAIYGTRVYARRISKSRFGVDDVLMGVGLFLSYGLTISTVISEFSGSLN